METTPKPLNVLVYMQGTHYIAQCLEYDIGTQAKNLDDLVASFTRVFAAQIMSDVRNSRKPFQDVPAAPDRFRDMFKQAKQLSDRPPLPIANDFGLDASLVPPAWMVAELQEMRVL